MAMLPLATVDDLAAWTGLSIEASDPRAEALLSAASALVRGYTGMQWQTGGVLDPVPDDVRYVVVQIAARVWTNPSNLESITIDDATRRWGSSGVAGLRLEESDRDALAGYLENGSSGLSALSVAVNDNRETTVYVPTGPPPSGYPFPWYSTDDLP